MKRRFDLLAIALLAAASASPAADLSLLDTATIADVAPCVGDGPAPVPEAALIAASPGVSRQGLVLKVGAAVFESSSAPDDSEDALSYVYLGRYRAAPLALVQEVRYEQMATLLVDPKSGERVGVGARPMPGPDGHTFAAVMRDDHSSETGDPSGGVDIVAWRNGKFEELGHVAGDFCAVGWRGADTLLLKSRVREAWRPARMVRGPDGWKLLRR